MNTTELKNFAIESRKILKFGVAGRFRVLGFNAEGKPTKGLPERLPNSTSFAGKVLEESFYDKWMSLYERIRHKGIKEVCEEAAYTWFNRLVATRIMQKNGLIEPVISYSYKGTSIPAIVAEARAGRLPHQLSPEERDKLIELLADDSKVREQFAILIENFCMTNPVIFNCFGGIDQYLSLLLPDDILAPGGFIELLNHTSFISDEDYRQSELIGWLYQFYISEKKDEVFDNFKSGKKAQAEDIPAATQIFTPNWIVKYMVQNTIGKIYLDNNPYSDLAASMKYLVKTDEPAPQEATLHLDDITDYKMIDPACGSGHILVEGFDLFFRIYKEEGYSPYSAIKNILSNNLIGIDLDTRAKQLATFALLMKAARIDRSVLDCKVLPRVLDMPRPCTEFKYDITNTLTLFFGSLDKTLIDETLGAFELLKQAGNLGSIMKFDMVSEATRSEMALKYKEFSEFNVIPDQIKEILPSIRLILALTDKYTSVAANPPYMGAGNMNAELSKYVQGYYSEGKADLCTAFVLKFKDLATDKASYGFIIPPSWLFLSTFESLRKKIIDEQVIDSVLHLSRGVFGADFGSVASVIRNVKQDNPTGTYFRLVERTFQEFEQNHLRLLFENTLRDHNFKYNFKEYDKSVTEIPYSEKGNKIYYSGVQQKDFEKIPGSPIGYWVSKALFNCIDNDTLDSICSPKKGLDTPPNDYYLKLWHEVAFNSIALNCNSRESFNHLGKKWSPVTKGGKFRKWYGNNDYIIVWENDGNEVKNNPNANIRNEIFYFTESLTWTDLSSGAPSFRYNKCGFIPNVAGPCVFELQSNLSYIIALLNSKPVEEILKITAPTMHFNVGAISNVPIIISNNRESIESLAEINIDLSKLDWDAHETSWDFQQNELIRIAKEKAYTKLEDAVKDYCAEWDEKFKRLHSNEEELNRQFIEIYGLQDELTPDVPLDEITILQAGEITHIKDENGGESYVWNYDNLMKQFLSYVVGCIMGRYRLDRPGLAIAYPKPSEEDIAPYEYNGLPFEIDDDGIIPLMSHSCPFNDNAYDRTAKFIKDVFGEESQIENLNYIEACLGTSIENYFIRDFWKNHKKMYRNKPIYWLFTSKKGTFQCLVYMHRMNPYTPAKVRAKYLLTYIRLLKANIETLTSRASLLTIDDRKELAKMQKDLDECLEYDSRLHDIADSQIPLDLDDGISVNYPKLGNVLAKIK